jgi:signal transduction histidine kinase
MDGSIDILLVDDEPRNLDALEAILSDRGYRLLRAEEADRALRLLLENDVAAIVLDIKMPRVNGIELAQIIKGTKRFREIPILFLSAHLVEDQDVLTGYGAGAVDYLTKPFNPQILRHKIAVFADLFRKTRALAELNDKLEQRVRERTAELERSEAALRAAARQKDDFLATLAHELRNPLAPLRTGLDLLIQMQAAPTQVASRTLSAMNRQLDHIVRLIDDLLDVSRINSGVLELKKEKVNLAKLLETVAESYQSILQQKDISLGTSASEQLSALVDPTRIAQIVGNLLHNASKFTPKGGSVRLELGYDDGDAIIRLIDSGVGIPPDQIERVFEMFARVQGSSSPGDRGAGIGLALAKRLAQMHGGELSAFSAGEGRGTTITLRLPGAELEPSLRRSTPAPAQLSAPTALFDILVIEDNEDVADTLAAWLESLGHRVTVARTGAEGVRLARTLRPQLVLCDIGLPEMDGIEVCLRVREMAQEFRPTMVALTGWGQEADRERTRNAGFDRHLVKPVAPELLSDVLRSIDARDKAKLPS